MATYKSERKKTIKERDKLADKSAKELLTYLIAISNEIRKDIKNIPEPNFRSHNLNSILEMVNSEIETLRNNMTTSLNSNVDKMFEFSIDKTDIEMGLLGAVGTSSILNPGILTPEKTLIGTLIKGFTEDQIKKVDNIVTLGLMGGKSTYQVAQDIKNGLKVSEGRAQAIAETEMKRVYNQTNFERLNQYQTNNPLMRKIWMHSGKPKGQARQSHVEAEFIYIGRPLKMNQYFIVDGEKMLYPMDPRASAKNTVFCGCWMDIVLGNK